MRITLIIQRFFGCCWALLILSQGILSVHALPDSGCTKSRERAWPEQLTQKDIPCYGTLCSVNKLRRVGQELLVCGGEWSGLGWVGGQWEIVLCSTCFSWVLLFSLSFPFTFSPISLLIIVVTIPTVVIIITLLFQLLNCSYLNTLFFWIFLPIPLWADGGWVAEQLCGTKLLSGTKTQGWSQ